MENIGIITMLKNYPELKETTVYTTNIFSVIKSMSTRIFFIALIVALITLGIKVLNRKTSANTV